MAQERACLIGRSGVGAREVQGQVLEREVEMRVGLRVEQGQGAYLSHIAVVLKGALKIHPG